MRQQWRQQSPPCTRQGVGNNSCCTGKNNTTQQQPAPSRRCPGTMPIGQTKQPQSSVQNKTRVYTSSYCSRNYRRRLHRSLWRWFKRTKLWGRANKAAQEHLKSSNSSKRKTFSSVQKWKIQLKSKKWFRNNKEMLRTRFKDICKFHRHKMARISTAKPSPQAKKLANQCYIRAACLNVRGLNKNTKREIIPDIMRRNKYDIMLLSETNVNSSSWEAWDGYYCFFSSSIDPKVREKEMKRKEEKKSQASKDRTTTYTHFRNAPDFENAGVAIVIKGTLVDSLKDIKQINGRMMKATFAASGSDISFFCYICAT